MNIMLDAKTENRTDIELNAQAYLSQIQNVCFGENINTQRSASFIEYLKGIVFPSVMLNLAERSLIHNAISVTLTNDQNASNGSNYTIYMGLANIATAINSKAIKRELNEEYVNLHDEIDKSISQNSLEQDSDYNSMLDYLQKTISESVLVTSSQASLLIEALRESVASNLSYRDGQSKIWMDMLTLKTFVDASCIKASL